jgi:hypothetical protein
MGKLAKLSELDFQGRDALPFFEKGGQILIWHLNLFLVQGHLQHNAWSIGPSNKISHQERGTHI